MIYHRISTFFVISLFVFITNSCNKKYDGLDNERSILIGMWNWDNTFHSFGWCDGLSLEETITPMSLGDTFTLEFEKKGKINFIANDELIDSKRLIFNDFQIGENDDFTFNISLDGNEDDVFFGLGNNEQIKVFTFPFVHIPGCESYLSTFIKQ